MVQMIHLLYGDGFVKTIEPSLEEFLLHVSWSEARNSYTDMLSVPCLIWL